MILTEGTAIAHPAAVSDPKVPRFHAEDALAGWAHVLAAVRRAGGHIMPQLSHVGTIRKPGDLPNSEAMPVGTLMTQQEIGGVIEVCAQGAANAQRLVDRELVQVDPESAMKFEYDRRRLRGAGGGMNQNRNHSGESHVTWSLLANLDVS